MKLILIILMISISIIYILNSKNIERFTQKEGTVNEVIENNEEIASYCDMNKEDVCYINGMPKKIVHTVIANIKEDDYYKKVFKNIRSYNSSNIYDCVDKINPLQSVTPL